MTGARSDVAPAGRCTSGDALAVLTVDLDAIGDNWRQLAARAAPSECAAVVKADAYGLGIDEVVPALARAGCRTFLTAHVSEGRRTRAALQDGGFSGRIFILGGFHPAAAPISDYLESGLAPVIGSMEELVAWERALGTFDAKDSFHCAIHLDTGMNRLGFPIEEARLLPHQRLIGARVGLVMSHLVSAEMPGDPLNARQIAGFEHARERALRQFPASLANSSGIFLPQRPFFDLVRPGYALYGGNPTPGTPNPMKPVVSLVARILQLRTVPAGASAGYNARWTASRQSRLATIGIGYADGLPIGASGIGGRGAKVHFEGLPCPIVGRVSMDFSIVDVTDVPVSKLAPGAYVELLGHNIDVDELGRLAGTIGYEILTNLGRRYRRDYIGSGASVS